MDPKDLTDEELHNVIVNNAVLNVTNRFMPERFNHIGLRNDIFDRGIGDAIREVSTIKIELIEPIGLL